MGIDRDEVLRIAALARLQIDGAEADALAGDLDRIVVYVARLAEADLPPDAPGLTYFDRDVHREDGRAPGLDRAAVLRLAPETDGESYLVPQVVDRE